MLGRSLVAVLVLFHVGLVTAATFHTADFAWVPSYFDHYDCDFLPLLLSEQMPARARSHLVAAVPPCIRARRHSRRLPSPRARPGPPRCSPASGLPPAR